MLRFVCEFGLGVVVDFLSSGIGQTEKGTQKIQFINSTIQKLQKYCFQGYYIEKT